MNIKSIKSEEDYIATLNQIETLMDAKPNTPQMGWTRGTYNFSRGLWSTTHYIIDTPDPIEAIKFRMEQEGLKQKDLVNIVGSKSRVSEILNKKRKLTIEMIWNLHKQLYIPVETLFLDYKINCA